MHRNNPLILIFVLISLVMDGCQSKNYDEMLESLYSHTVPLIQSKELAAKLDTEKSVVLLDIRSVEEFEVSHIKGAKFIDYDTFTEKDVESIPKETEVVVYCSVGYRSEKIGERLLEMGYPKVKNLYGGIFQWKNKGFDVVNEKSVETDSVHTYNRKWSKWLNKGIKVY